MPLPPLDEILTRHDPQIASILLGTNDLRAGVSPERFLENMEKIFRHCLISGTIPIAQTLPPTTWDTNENLEKYNQGLRELAERLRLPFIDVYGEFLARRPEGSWLGTLVTPRPQQAMSRS